MRGRQSRPRLHRTTRKPHVWDDRTLASHDEVPALRAAGRGRGTRGARLRQRQSRAARAATSGVGATSCTHGPRHGSQSSGFTSRRGELRQPVVAAGILASRSSGSARRSSARTAPALRRASVGREAAERRRRKPRGTRGCRSRPRGRRVLGGSSTRPGPRYRAAGSRTQKLSPRSASSLAYCSAKISFARAGVTASSGLTSSIWRLVLSS
jgi:hypothetical protein